MKRSSYFVSIIIILFSKLAFSQDINTEEAKKYFNELKSIADKDSKKMWGEYLYGPVMFVNPRTREIITNENDASGSLKNIGGVYAGRLSERDMLANTAYEWHGKIWTMILMPLPKSDYERRVLLVHESFHRVQEKIGLVSASNTNNHLDEKEARILLRMEWGALFKALNDNAAKKLHDIKSALVFRELRRLKYPGCDESENALEIHEGLAEYTGIKLGIGNEPDRIKYIARRISDASGFPSFVRSFPYISGPLYCMLLDQTNTSWRSKLNNCSDLGEFTKKVYQINLDMNLKQTFEYIKSEYSFGKINDYEQQREIKKSEVVNEYKAKFAAGRILTIPLINMKIQFDPRNLISLGNYGTVYPTLKIVDNWGILEVNKGALLTPDWKKVIVTYPENISGNLLSGKGWKLTLNAGWKYLNDGINLIISK